MMSAIQRIARGMFFAREAARSSARETAPERSQFDYDSFEHVEGLHLSADQCWRSSSLGLDDEADGRRAPGPASMPARASARLPHGAAASR